MFEQFMTAECVDKKKILILIFIGKFDHVNQLSKSKFSKNIVISKTALESQPTVISHSFMLPSNNVAHSRSQFT